MKRKYLNGKSVLLLCPSFFGYEMNIKDKLTEMGANVIYQDDDPSSIVSTLFETCWHFQVPDKLLISYFEGKVYNKISKYRYDVVIVINGWAIRRELIKKIKKSLLLPNGKMILYYWDSLKVLNDDEKRRELFDAVYTFDNIDYESNKSTMKFLPLFYCDKYYSREFSTEQTYDLLTIGSYKYNRYFEIQSIKNNNPDILVNAILYAKKVVYLHKILRKKYKNINIKEFIYKPLSKDEIIEEFKHSKAILDIPYKGQNGLTMRTFECLGMRKKIVTTNKNIMNYDFYNPDYIFVLDSDNYELPSKEWFDKKVDMPDDIIKKYSISSWLYNLLEL